MKFDQDLDGLVYDGQHIPVRDEELDIARVTLDFRERMTLDKWKEQLRGKDYRMATMPEAYKYFKAVLASAKIGNRDGKVRLTELRAFSRIHEHPLFTATVARYNNSDKIDITYNEFHQGTWDWTTTERLETEKFRLTMLPFALYLEYTQAILDTKDSFIQIQECLTELTQLEEHDIEIWSALPDSAITYPTRHICMANYIDKDRSTALGAHVYGENVTGFILKVRM